MRIAMAHDGFRMQAMTDRFSFDFQHLAMNAMQTGEYLRNMVIPVHQAIARDLTVHFSGAIDWSFKPIDATPTFTTRRIEKLEDLCHFAAPLVRTKEIIIPEESVPALMERILKLQQPAKTERLREQMRNPEGVSAIPQQKFEAQIISFQKAA